MTELVGILAIQGAYIKHEQCFQKLGIATRLIRNRNDLANITRLVIPGGESTTMVKLLKKHDLWEGLVVISQKIPVMGTCAGAILMSAKPSKSVDVLSCLDIYVERNYYGRQADSFINDIDLNLNNDNVCFNAIFIRAPAILEYNAEKVKILASVNDQPVLVQQGRNIAMTFHPELSNNLLIHKYFIQL